MRFLLAHNPVYFDAYKKWGAGSGAFRASSRRDYPSAGNRRSDHASGDSVFRNISGEMTTEGEQTIIVSRGLGTHTINLRFLNEAEMIVIHLRGGEKDKLRIWKRAFPV